MKTGFPLTRSIGSYNSKGVSDTGHGISRLSSQSSFTRDDALSCISGERENGRRKTAHSYATTSFGMGSWDDSSAGFFSVSPGKRARNIGGDHCANTAESQVLSSFRDLFECLKIREMISIAIRLSLFLTVAGETIEMKVADSSYVF